VTVAMLLLWSVVKIGPEARRLPEHEVFVSSPAGSVLCGACRSWVAPRHAQTAQGPWRYCAACGASMGPAPPPPVSADTGRAWSQVALVATALLIVGAACALYVRFFV